MLSAELDQKCRTAISPGSTGWGVGSIQRDRVQPKAQATRSFPSYCRLLPPLPAEHASLSLHAAVPLSLLRSPSSSRDWRGVEIHRSSDWFLLLLVRNAGSLRLGCAFCDFVLRSLVFVVSPQIRIFRSARNGLRTAWLITVAFYFIFYCIMSAALLFCFLGNVKPFQ